MLLGLRRCAPRPRPPGFPVREFPGIANPQNSRREFPWISEILAGRTGNFASCVFFSNFYRAAWNADAVLRWDLCPSVRPSVCLSVCLSVCPSVKRVHCDKNGRKICSDFYTLRKIIQSSFIRRRMVGGGDPFYLKFWVNRPALERNRGKVVGHSLA